MGGVCYKKNQERGLWFEIKKLEELIANDTIDEEYRKFCKKLLRSYKKYSQKDYEGK